MNISGKTQVYGVIGDPIEHTLSPTIQNAAFKALKMDCVFVAFHVKTGEVENAIRGMRGLGIAGLSVTMPHKNPVISLLDKVDPAAEFLGSVNTILNDNGELSGFSTDGLGAVQALKTSGVELNGKKILLIGGGGAARAIAYTLAKEVEELKILNRSPEKIKDFTKTLSREFNKQVSDGLLEPSAIQENLQHTDVLINATSVGMHPNAEHSLVEHQWMRRGLTVMDIVYNPIKTKLSKDAEKAGAKVVSGVEMLIHQGAAAFGIWTGKKAPIEVMRKASLDKLAGAKT